MNATQAAVPVTLGQQEFQFSPLTLEDLEHLELWMKSEVIRTVTDGISETTPADVREMLVKSATDQANQINIFRNGFAKLMTAGGLMRMIHRMVLHKHPEVQLSEVKKWCEDRQSIDRILPSIELLIPRSKTPEAKRGTKRKPRKRSTARR
jgi:hypothetical protein